MRSVLCSGAATFGWKTGTLYELAQDIIGSELAASARHIASPALLEAVCARAVAEAAAAGTIAPYESIADRPGLSRALARTISELRGGRLDEAELPPGLSPLLARSLALLAEEGAVDGPASLRMAAEQLDAGGTMAPVLFLDPPIRSLLERELAVSALRASSAAAVTLPSQDSFAREAIEVAFDTEFEALEPSAGDALGRLQRFLFAEASPPLSPLDDSVLLLSAPGEGRECIEVVRRIHKAASAGTPYDRMAVLLRREMSHRVELEEALRRGGVPAFFARGSSVPDPSARALLILMVCAEEGLAVGRFIEYLSLRQLGSEVKHRVWEQLLIEARAIGGLDRIQRRLEQLVSQHQSEQLQLLRERGLPLFRALDALPEADTWSSWSGFLEALAEQALEEPSQVLGVLRELRPMDSGRSVSLGEVRLFLTRRLGERRIAPEHRVAGAVFVGSAQDARGRSFDLVFVPGLAEGVFPERVVEDPMLLDVQRAQLSADLATNAQRSADERLALQLAAGAASKQLVLSWSRIDGRACRPRVPSFYALEVMRASRGMLPSFEALAQEADRVASARLGWPAPEDPADAIDAAEHDLALFARVRRRPESEARGTMRYLLSVNPNLARSLRARARRWELDHYSLADGLLQPRAQGLAAISQHGLAQRSYSATALQNFANCPYRFLLQTVHRLRKRAAPESLEYLGAQARGSLIHQIQFEFLTALRDADQLPLSSTSCAAAIEQLDASIDRVAQRTFDELAPAIDRVWQDAVASIRADLHEWLRRIADEGRWVPLHFELSFGLKDTVGRDEASRPASVQLDCGIALRGSIDLVERDAEGVLRVTDYKTGIAEVPQDSVILGGTSLQPVLYALAAEKLFEDARVESGRLDYCTTRGQFRHVTVRLGEEARRDIEFLARTLSARLDKGAFPAAPREGACVGCDYLPVCGPHEEFRIRRKDARGIEDLIALRSLP
jgi:RecB family exonuclease